MLRYEKQENAAHLLGAVDHHLHNALDTLKFRTHVLAGPNWRDGVGKRGRTVWIGQDPIPDGGFTFSFAVLLELHSPSSYHAVIDRGGDGQLSLPDQDLPFDTDPPCVAYSPSRLDCRRSANRPSVLL